MCRRGKRICEPSDCTLLAKDWKSIVKSFEEIEMLRDIFTTFEGIDSCEASGHCEHHSYCRDPQFLAKRREEFFPFNISEIGLLKEGEIAEKKGNNF